MGSISQNFKEKYFFISFINKPHGCFYWTYQYQSKCAYFENRGGDVGMKVLTQMGKKNQDPFITNWKAYKKVATIHFNSITCGE